MNFNFASVLNFFKKRSVHIFLFLVILLGILLSFVYNNHLQKTDTNKEASTIPNYNKSSKTITANKIKNPDLKHAADNNIVSGSTGKAANLNKFMNKGTSSKSFAAPLKLPTYNSTDFNNLSPYPTDPACISGAAPCTIPCAYNPPPTFFAPPPIVVVARTTTPPPPEIPIPEPSSMILGFMGLSGIWGLRKKLLQNN